VVASERTRHNKQMKYRKLRIRFFSTLFPRRVAEHWSWLYKKAVESPSLDIFKICLDKLMSRLLSLTLVCAEGLEVPQLFCISVILSAWIQPVPKASCERQQLSRCTNSSNKSVLVSNHLHLDL